MPCKTNQVPLDDLEGHKPLSQPALPQPSVLMMTAFSGGGGKSSYFAVDAVYAQLHSDIALIAYEMSWFNSFAQAYGRISNPDRYPLDTGRSVLSGSLLLLLGEGTVIQNMPARLPWYEHTWVWTEQDTKALNPTRPNNKSIAPILTIDTGRKAKDLHCLDSRFRCLYGIRKGHMGRILVQEIIPIGFVFKTQDEPVREAVLCNVGGKTS